MKRIYILLAYGICFLGHAQTMTAQVPDSLSRLFVYPKASKPQFVVDSSFVEEGVRIQRITYLSADTFLVSAYLMLPSKPVGASPVIIFNHWGEGDKEEFRKEAITLTKLGFVALLPDAPWQCPGSTLVSFKKQAFDLYRQNVTNTRAGLDMLEAQFQIDTERIFCVGHSFGCNTAAMLSAIEPRIDHFVFMAGLYSMTENIINTTLPDFLEWKTEDPIVFDQWVQKMRILDAKHYLPYKKVPCLIQVALKDEYVSNEENEEFIAGTPKPKQALRYEATHSLNDQSKLDRMNWIMRQMRQPSAN